MLHVYLASFNERLTERKEREFLARMPLPIVESIQRYRRWEDRQARLLGKLLLDYAFQVKAAGSGFSILERLEYNSAGKPFVSGEPDFNISHSGEMIVLSLVDEGMTGIDIEMIRPVNFRDFIRYLPELSDFDAMEPSQRQSEFYCCWTKKEAVLKGEGTGLSGNIDQVILQMDEAFIFDRKWHLRKIDCGSDYCCHVSTSERYSECLVEEFNY
jgi:4'-phosphopantetheinyl transferase